MGIKSKRIRKFMKEYAKRCTQGIQGFRPKLPRDIRDYLVVRQRPISLRYYYRKEL